MKTPKPISRRIVGTGIAATIVIGAGAFVLSFSALTDLAVRAGINPTIAWMWPLIVDGMIVAATVAIVALAGRQGREQLYPWILLFFGAIVSTAANSIHAVLAVRAENGNVPVVVSALVAAMPPVVLLAITHLTVLLVQYARSAAETSVRAAEEAAGLAELGAEVDAAMAGLDVDALEAALAGDGPEGDAASAPKPARPARKPQTSQVSSAATPAGGTEEAPKAAPKRKPRKAAASATSRPAAATGSVRKVESAAAGESGAGEPASAESGAGDSSTAGAPAPKGASAARPNAKSGLGSGRPIMPDLSTVTSVNPLLRGPAPAERSAEKAEVTESPESAKDAELSPELEDARA
ncbi:DUF2637 domain-containing protein [Sinomonas sp. R1AF57]|uniref:DUF2637 domain-containing protein n=1 Tax=Sinomonas sp. R1AF57 TaxID=2020377 RepID=UPI000B5FE508|nr:DUF2637 domain-containing protein [Sinomonas sp. R1AF57]ASN54128.1 excisionase [Sinomonas sp. R1AF57]